LQANHIISTVDLAVSTMVNAIEYPQVGSMMHFEQEQIEVLKLPSQKAAMLLVEALLKLLNLVSQWIFNYGYQHPMFDDS